MGSSSGPQPNNSYAMVITGRSIYLTRFKLYCCSSSQYSNGTLTHPSGSQSVSVNNGHVSTYSSTSSLGGCISFTISYYTRYYSRSFYFYDSGVYTCSFDNEFSSIALYSSSSSGMKRYNVSRINRIS